MVYGSTQNTDVREEVNYLAGSKPVNVTPSYATIDEMVYYVIESNEKDYNNMMMNIGIAELHHLEETGTEMVYEAEDGKGGKIRSLVDSAVKLFQKLWSKFQGMIENAISTLNEKAAAFRKNVINKIGEKKLIERANDVAADKDFGKSYAYPNIRDAAKGASDEATSNITKVDAAVANAVAKSDKEHTEAVNELPDKLDEIISAARKSVAGDGVKSPSDIKKAVQAKARGAEVSYKGAKVKSDFKAILKEVAEFGEAKNTLKADYKRAQKAYNTAIKSAKTHTFMKRGFDAKAYSMAIRAYKDLTQLIVYAEQATISCLNERNRFYTSIVIKVAGTRSKKEKDEKKPVGESSTFDRVASLFEW